MPTTRAIIAILVAAVPLLSACAGKPDIYSVRPAVETAPVRTAGDAADDPAVWVHPTDYARSLIIGTDKHRGLIAYDLDGQVVHEAPRRINNVDVLHGFPGAQGAIDLAIGSDREGNHIAIFEITERGFRNAAARTITVEGGSVYGLCAMRSPRTDACYVFVNTTADEVQQWRLVARAAGVDAELVRRFSVGGHAEGMVVDPETDALFIAEEDLGIWKYQAEPAWLTADRGAAHEELSSSQAGPRTLIAQVGRDPLAADVEGLTIYPEPDGGGYLLASNQGDSTFAVFDRAPPHAYRFSFVVAASDAIDAVSATDGIEACAVPLGNRFPMGILVVQDDDNEGENQNFKIIPWERVAEAARASRRFR